MSRVNSVRFIPVLLVAALLPVLAGCGSGSDVGAAADVVPADVFVYASVDTDFDGDGWAALEEFAARFPNGENSCSRSPTRSTPEEGIDFEADVEPALGDEVAFVVLDAPARDPLAEGTSESFVLLLQPDDDAAFQRLLKKSDEPPVTDEVDGWTVVAEDQESLDSFRADLDGPRLDGSEAFERAMEDLDDSALARVFVNGAKLSGRTKPTVEKPPDDALLPGGAALLRHGFDVESDSARIDGRAVFAGEPVRNGLLLGRPSRVPGDVLAYVSFNDLESAFLDVPRRCRRVRPGGRAPAGQPRRSSASPSRRTCCRCSRARARSTSGRARYPGGHAGHRDRGRERGHGHARPDRADGERLGAAPGA